MMQKTAGASGDLPRETVTRRYILVREEVYLEGIRKSSALSGFAGRELSPEERAEVVSEYRRITKAAMDDPRMREARQAAEAAGVMPSMESMNLGPAIMSERRLRAGDLEAHILFSSTPPAEAVLEAYGREQPKHLPGGK
jgi:hypothetical protein